MKPWENSEGYPDPTAYDALKVLSEQQSEDRQRISAVIHIVRCVLDLAGFQLVGRIELQDKRTGRVYM